MRRRRVATLVVVGSDGAVRGALAPTTIDEPWWQQVAPIADAVPDSAVLRLLDAEPGPGETMGGRVTYLVESDGDLDLTAWSGSLDTDPHRQPWADVGGPTAAIDWVRGIVDLTGPPRQIRTWNLSAVWSIGTTVGPLWLKCVPHFFAHEATVLEHLAVGRGPRIVAAAGHRLLLEEMPGTDGHDATAEEKGEMIDALVTIQVESVSAVARLAELGVPDLRSGPLAAELATLVERVAADRPDLLALASTLPERLAAVEECGLPDTLVHGDAHPGNARRGVSPPLWFDWGDSFVGHPMLDLVDRDWLDAGLRSRWWAAWADAVPGSDPRRASRLLEPVAALRLAWVYQRFLDNIEPSEHVYHRADVAEMLDHAEARARR